MDTALEETSGCSIHSQLTIAVFRKKWILIGLDLELQGFQHNSCGTLAMKTFISDLILLDGIETDFDFIFQSQKISNLCRSSDSLSYWFLQAAYLTIIPHADELKRFKLIIPNKEMIFFCIS